MGNKLNMGKNEKLLKKLLEVIYNYIYNQSIRCSFSEVTEVQPLPYSIHKDDYMSYLVVFSFHRYESKNSGQIDPVIEVLHALESKFNPSLCVEVQYDTENSNIEYELDFEFDSSIKFEDIKEVQEYLEKQAA